MMCFLARCPKCEALIEFEELADHLSSCRGKVEVKLQPLEVEVTVKNR